MKKLSILIVLLSATFCSFSQWTPSIGMIANITPTYNIAGTDTNVENTLTIAPSFTIRNKAGWGLTYSPSFLTGGAKPGLFMHSIKAGVEQYDKKIIDYTANYIHYFFTGNTSLPYSPLTNEISASIVYKRDGCTLLSKPELDLAQILLTAVLPVLLMPLLQLAQHTHSVKILTPLLILP